MSKALDEATPYAYYNLLYGAAQTYLVAVNPRAHVPAILKAEHIQGEEQRPTVESGSGRVTCVPRACDDGPDGDTNRWSGGRKNQLKARIDREPYGSTNGSRKSMENRKEERISGVNRRRRRRKRKSMEQEQLDRGNAPPPCIPGAAPATLFPFPSFPTTLALSLSQLTCWRRLRTPYPRFENCLDAKATTRRRLKNYGLCCSSVLKAVRRGVVSGR